MRRAAAIAILVCASGCGGVLRLVAQARHPDPKVRARACERLGDEHWPSSEQVAEVLDALCVALRDDNPKVRSSAATALVPNIGPASGSGRSAAYLAERKLRPTRMLALAELLGDPNADVRVRAVSALARFGFALRPAAPALVRALKDTEPHVRVVAAWSLAKADLHSDEALSTIVEALTDWDADARRVAAETLGRLGARAKIAVPTLERTMLRDPVAWVADEAAAAARKIEPDRALPKTRRRGVPFGPF